MGELGADAAAIHESAGRTARALGIDRLYAQGAFASRYASGFGSGAAVFADHASLIAALDADLQQQGADSVTLLVKGSRSARMDVVVKALAGDDAPNQSEMH